MSVPTEIRLKKEPRLLEISFDDGSIFEYTFEYLRGREFSPQGEAFERAVAWWRSMSSDPQAGFDDRVELEGGEIEPTVTWGINPGQSCGVTESLPSPQQSCEEERASIEAVAGAPDKVGGVKEIQKFAGDMIPINSGTIGARVGHPIEPVHQVLRPQLSPGEIVERGSALHHQIYSPAILL